MKDMWKVLSKLPSGLSTKELVAWLGLNLLASTGGVSIFDLLKNVGFKALLSLIGKTCSNCFGGLNDQNEPNGPADLYEEPPTVDTLVTPGAKRKACQ
jgi:hypothetical protein